MSICQINRQIECETMFAHFNFFLNEFFHTALQHVIKETSKKLCVYFWPNIFFVCVCMFCFCFTWTFPRNMKLSKRTLNYLYRSLSKIEKEMLWIKKKIILPDYVLKQMLCFKIWLSTKTRVYHVFHLSLFSLMYIQNIQ